MRTFFIPRRHYEKVVFGLAVVVVWATLLLVNLDLNAASDQVGAPVYNGSSQNNQVSFAINVDWGEEYIPQMLQIFEDNNIKCTFFLTGRWAAKNEALAAAIKSKGHEIGNHAYSHKSPNSMTKEQNMDEITRTDVAIKKATGATAKLYAPPSGECESQVLEASQATAHYCILWSVDTIDWQRPRAETIISRVLPKVKSGSIILMHPTEGTVEALPTLIKEIKHKGLKPAPVSVNANLNV